MDYVIMIGQLFLSLSILIVLHEMGHFFPARWFNTRVEKFYLFFDPWFSLFKIKRGDTEYGIGWLPLGGYVKISGMVDESFDTEQLKNPPQPWEFRSKPAWQRLIIMLGGVTVNFLLGFFIYGVVLFVWGEQYLPASSAKYGIMVDSLGYDMGLRNGDHILFIGDKPYDRMNDRTIVREIILNNTKSMGVRRDGKEISVSIDSKFTTILATNSNKGKGLFRPRTPFVISDFLKDFPDEKSDLKKGDQLIAFNNTPTRFFDEFKDLSQQNKNQEITVTAIRDKKDTIRTLVSTNEVGMMGIQAYGFDYFFDVERQKYSLAQAMPAGIKKGVSFLNDQMKAFGQMFSGKIKASESLGGFGSIGSLYGTEWIWERFWSMTAALSLILAFMNLLPIPALDGGHVMFLLYEVATGREPNEKFMEYATLAGFILVLALVLYANGLDIMRAWF